MTRDELIELVAAAYKFAGVPGPERMAAAFEAANPARDLPLLSHSPVPSLPPGGEKGTPEWDSAGVPSCPECAAPAAQVCWLGALPDKSGHWRCTRCAHGWATPPAGSAERAGNGDLA